MKVRLILVLSLALSMSALVLSGQQAEPQRRSVGRSVDRAWTRVAVRPMGIKCPAEAAQPPAVAVSSNDFARLERTIPVYTVKIHADGRVIWQHWQQKIADPIEIPVSKIIQPEDARALIESHSGVRFLESL